MDVTHRPPAAVGADAEPLCNHSSNLTFADVLARNIARRNVLKGGLGAALTGTLAVGAPAGAQGLWPPDEPRTKGRRRVELGFEPVAVTRADTITVPAGYVAQVLLPWGTPLCGSYPPYFEGGLNTAADQEQQAGMHHDGMHYFALYHGPAGNRHGLLVINHEYIDQNALHPNGATVVSGIRTVPDEVRKEIAAHGVSVAEIRRSERTGLWELVRGRYNRRITGATRMEITGPVRGSRLVQTRYSPAGTHTRGTLNNCAHGYTPWGTYLTCEENWAGYFVNRDAVQPREHARYGVGRTSSRYRWDTVAGDEFERFDASTRAAAATGDYRNEPNAFGWIVEIDPWDPKSTPKKRTALGRFAHEGIVFAPVKPGRPLVCYSGDDARDEYIYKFVTKERYVPGKFCGDMLDEGTLYVARFDEDGTGEWLPLDFDDPDLRAAAAAKGVSFQDQADLLVNTRLAADVVGATKMDRPEWGAVHPRTGEVYFTLTNNTSRTAEQTDGTNPRGPNPYGHIIHWRESGRRGGHDRFEWDIFLLAGPESDSAILAAPGDTVPSLDAANIFASPDGLWFDPNGLLWIQTDMSGSQLTAGPFGNNAMLAADPASGDIRRFLVGPYGCEVTGVVTTPNGRTMFVNIQHPGEPPPSTWPDGGTARPRSATVIITRDDGGIIGT